MSGNSILEQHDKLYVADGRGKRLAVVVSIERYESLLRAAGREDEAAELDERRPRAKKKRKKAQ